MALLISKPLKVRNGASASPRGANSHQKVGMIPTQNIEQPKAESDELALLESKPLQGLPADPQQSFGVKADMIPPKEMRMKFVIETCKVGLLFGKNGWNIKRIQNITSCKITIHGESSEWIGGSTGTITGNEDQCNRAKAIIKADFGGSVVTDPSLLE